MDAQQSQQIKEDDLKIAKKIQTNTQVLLDTLRKMDWDHDTAAVLVAYENTTSIMFGTMAPTYKAIKEACDRICKKAIGIRKKQLREHRRIKKLIRSNEKIEER